MSETSRQVLVIDGDASARRDVRTACEQDGYQVLEADSAAEGLRLHASAHPSLVLLEVSLPDGSGFDACREIRRTDPASPVIMMSGRSDEIDVVVALEIGADDYVTKPLRLRELAARVAAHLRRARMESAEAMRTRLEFRDLVIDVNERRIYKSGKEVELTHTEFDLLTFLASNAGKVLSREKILNSIWGYEYPIETRVIDVHIRNPRWMLADHRRSGEIDKAFPVEATFELEAADVDAIEAVGGKGIVKAAETLIVQKDYANKSHVSLPDINERVTVIRLLETAKLPDGLRGIVGEPATVADLAARLGEIEHAVPKIDKPTEQAVAKLEDAIRSQFPEGVVQALESLILQRMPSFLYFSEYSQLQGKVDLEHLFDAAELDPSQLTARSLLRLAHADNESILALDYEERRSELEAAANRLTQEVGRYWSQSSELKVDIDVEMAPGGSGQIAKYLQIRVEDLRHGFSNRFDQRSSGFRWFFSFLAAFHEFERQNARVAI